MQSKSQRFANTVFPNVQAMAELQQEAKKQGGGKDLQVRKYKSLCKRAGSLVRNSGLMQTVAFFEARANKDEHYKILRDHLKKELKGLDIIRKEESLLDYVRSRSLPQYMYLTREVLHLLNWHKRLADAMITGTADHQGEDDR